jgi:hypothetical protein
MNINKLLFYSDTLNPLVVGSIKMPGSHFDNALRYPKGEHNGLCESILHGPADSRHDGASSPYFRAGVLSLSSGFSVLTASYARYLYCGYWLYG